jgi:Protein of Unknown function (DUF2784)
VIHRALARFVIAIHAAYVAFVVFGSLLVIHWPALIWIHLAAVAWAVATLVLDFGCPLTPWEKGLWKLGGIEPYPEGFLQHHILRARYPAEHTRRNHAVLGVLVLALNVAIYSLVLLKR